MSDSIWKKEISFSRKKREEQADAPAEPKQSIWKKEITIGRKRAPEPEQQPAAPAPPPVVEELPFAPVVAAPAPPVHELPVVPLSVEAVQPHPPFAPPVQELPVVPLSVEALQPHVPPAPPVEQLPVVPQYSGLSAAIVAASGEESAPEPVVAPEPVAAPVWPVAAHVEPEPEPVAAPEPEPAPTPAVAAEPKTPFYKKDLSLRRRPKPAKQEREATTPFWKKDLSLRRRKPEPVAAEAASEAPTQQLPKTPFWKKDLSLRRAKAPAAPKRTKEQKRGHKVQRLVGLKIGASQLAAARVANNGAAELLQVAREPLDPGVVINGELRDPDALAEALKRFFARHKLPRKGVRLGIASNRIGVRIFELDGIADDKQLENAIRFRAQETLPIPLDEAVLDYRVVGESVDENGNATRRVLLVVAYRELVDRYVAACKKAGISLVGIDLDAFALLRALGAPRADDTTPDAAVVAVAIGHDRSTFAVSDGRVCEFTRVLEWGGASISVALARALDMAPSEVEAIKRSLSLETTDAPDGLTPQQATVALDAVRKQVQSFARELVSSLQFYQQQPGSLGIGEIVLTGGTAHLGGVADELQRLIGVRVRVGDPLARLKVGKKIGDVDPLGSYAIAIGLGIED